jgi:putative hydrolase of the HAD superfamily
MVIRAVVLDLDGTLVDHEGASDRGLRAWLEDRGVDPTDRLSRAWRAAEDRHLQAWHDREIDFAEQRRRRLRDFLPRIGVEPTGDLDAVFAGYLRHYQASWRAFDDVEDGLAAIRGRGLAVAVLTNGTVEQQNAKLARVGLAGRVGPVITAAELPAGGKPDATSYRAACARLGVAPGDVLHVGDRYDLDVVAARAAGLRAVHLDRPGTGPAGERCRITSLRDLGPLLDPDAGCRHHR